MLNSTLSSVGAGVGVVVSPPGNAGIPVGIPVGNPEGNSEGNPVGNWALAGEGRK